MSLRVDLSFCIPALRGVEALLSHLACNLNKGSHNHIDLGFGVIEVSLRESIAKVEAIIMKNDKEAEFEEIITPPIN